MNPGPEMDALVAEKVMGCKVVDHPQPHLDPDRKTCGCHKLSYPHNEPSYDNEYAVFDDWIKPYSTSISAAWEVVEKMSKTTKEYWRIHVFSSGASVEFSYEGGRDLPWIPGDYEMGGADAPHAICLAALKAVGAM